MQPSVRHRQRTRRLERFIEGSKLDPGEPFPCPYLPGRQACQVAILPPPLTPGLYHSLMDLNFRRLGFVYYRPACPDCQECRSLRVLCDEFVPDRSQRRCRRRNADVEVELARPRPSQDKHRLYQRYLRFRHDGQMTGSWEEFTSFLYEAPGNTLEVVYRVDGRLLGVGLVDVEPEALSAVYHYFDPGEQARAPGVFNILWLIDECRRRGVSALYLGYHVAACAAMSHKARYRPHELLEPGTGWRSMDAPRPGPSQGDADFA